MAVHPQAEQIFWTPVQAFAAEVLPERDPSRADVGLRADVVCNHADGTAVRIHPHEGKEAQIVDVVRFGEAPLVWNTLPLRRWTAITSLSRREPRRPRAVAV